MEYFCIQKNRDKSNNIISYTLKDPIANEVIITPSKELKALLQQHKIAVSNLKLNSRGAIISISPFMSETKVSHTPNQKLTPLQEDYLMQHGLVHFFHMKYLRKHQEYGVFLNWGKGKELSKKETNLLWFYLADINTLKDAASEYLTKHASHRPDAYKDLAVAFWLPTEEEVKRIKFRPSGSGNFIYGTFDQPAFVYDKDIENSDRLYCMSWQEYLDKLRKAGVK